MGVSFFLLILGVHGYTIVFTGMSGSGKSSLIRHLCGSNETTVSHDGEGTLEGQYVECHGGHRVYDAPGYGTRQFPMNQDYVNRHIRMHSGVVRVVMVLNHRLYEQDYVFMQSIRLFPIWFHDVLFVRSHIDIHPPTEKTVGYIRTELYSPHSSVVMCSPKTGQGVEELRDLLFNPSLQFWVR